MEKVTMIQVILDALKTVSKSQKKKLGELEIRRIKTTHTTTAF